MTICVPFYICNSGPSLSTSRVRWRETSLFPVVFLKDGCSVDDMMCSFLSMARNPGRRQ